RSFAISVAAESFGFAHSLRSVLPSVAQDDSKDGEPFDVAQDGSKDGELVELLVEPLARRAHA
ncbi:MAG: hypothetical protein ABIC18_00200, partial [Candidatus Omnitrophota bacterium]